MFKRCEKCHKRVWFWQKQAVRSTYTKATGWTKERTVGHWACCFDWYV